MSPDVVGQMVLFQQAVQCPDPQALILQQDVSQTQYQDPGRVNSHIGSLF